VRLPACTRARVGVRAGLRLPNSGGSAALSWRGARGQRTLRFMCTLSIEPMRLWTGHECTRPRPRVTCCIHSMCPCRRPVLCASHRGCAGLLRWVLFAAFFVKAPFSDGNANRQASKRWVRVFFVFGFSCGRAARARPSRPDQCHFHDTVWCPSPALLLLHRTRLLPSSHFVSRFGTRRSTAAHPHSAQ
jgi:hypothetical protein